MYGNMRDIKDWAVDIMKIANEASLHDTTLAIFEVKCGRMG